MKNIIKPFIIAFILSIPFAGFGQCQLDDCNPALTGVSFSTSCVNLNGNAQMFIGWRMNAGDFVCTAPAGSWFIQISLPQSGPYYAANGLASITGAGFNWTYNSSNTTFNGTSNQAMNFGSLGTITINLIGSTSSVCSPVQTGVNIQLQPDGFPFFGCTAAFQDQPDNFLQSSMGVSTLLPIELSSFIAKNGKCGEAIVDWVTSSERNSDFMELERSEDGKTFEPVYKVTSLNVSSGGKYAFSDRNVLGGTRYLYRLRQVDFDGASEYLKTISIETDHCSGGGVSLSLHPNPAFDKVNVSLNGLSENDRVKLIITNVIGEVVMSIPDASASEVNEIKLNGLTAGIYNVKLVGFEETTSKRFIKVD